METPEEKTEKGWDDVETISLQSDAGKDTPQPATDGSSAPVSTNAHDIPELEAASLDRSDSLFDMISKSSQSVPSLDNPTSRSELDLDMQKPSTHSLPQSASLSAVQPEPAGSSRAASLQDVVDRPTSKTLPPSPLRPTKFKREFSSDMESTPNISNTDMGPIFAEAPPVRARSSQSLVGREIPPLRPVQAAKALSPVTNPLKERQEPLGGFGAQRTSVGDKQPAGSHAAETPGLAPLPDTLSNAKLPDPKLQAGQGQDNTQSQLPTAKSPGASRIVGRPNYFKREFSSDESSVQLAVSSTDLSQNVSREVGSEAVPVAAAIEQPGHAETAPDKVASLPPQPNEKSREPKSVLQSVKDSMARSVKSTSDLFAPAHPKAAAMTASSSSSSLSLQKKPPMASSLKKASSPRLKSSSSQQLRVTIAHSNFSPVEKQMDAKDGLATDADSTASVSPSKPKKKSAKKHKPPGETTPSESAGESPSSPKRSKKAKAKIPPSDRDEAAAREKYYQNLENKLNYITAEQSLPEKRPKKSKRRESGDGQSSSASTPSSPRRSKSSSSVPAEPAATPKEKKTKKNKAAKNDLPLLFQSLEKTADDFKDSIISLWIHKTDSLSSNANIKHPLVQIHVL
ncbi:hypothetical protein HDU91_001153, partial [Kappamyces sp. JEL0680]